MSKEMVDHPPHYNAGSIEVFDFLEAWDEHIGYAGGCVIKYVCRHRLKGNPLEDLRKAQWYLRKMIEQQERKQNGDKAA